MFKRVVPIVPLQCHSRTGATPGTHYDSRQIIDCECKLGNQCAPSFAGESDAAFSAEFAVDSVVRLN